MKKIGNFFGWIWDDLCDIGATFAQGDFKTKLSFLIMGFGSIARGAILRGIAFLATEVGFILYMIMGGAKYLSLIGTLGTVATHKESQIIELAGGLETEIETTVYGQNSFLILLYGVIAIIVTLLFIFLWRLNIRENKREEALVKAGRTIPSFGSDLRSLVDSNFDKTLLALPVIGVFLFVVVPIIFMICVAFTNYNGTHNPPDKLFTWVGLQNFKKIFQFSGNGLGQTFMRVLGWTLIWAFFATFLTYFGGMGLAILINNKNVKLKKMWRTIFVMTIAVPQFISLLYVKNLFSKNGIIMNRLVDWGILKEKYDLWGHAGSARALIIIINMWVGTPYVMLMCSGLLMNIPSDLYESARIDGANAWQMFYKITLPYMLFVTGPYLLTSFTGNLNNFNVIYLLNGGSPTTLGLTGGAGSTDLLVTWLYKLTVQKQAYGQAAVLGILVFVVVAVISLVVYNFLPSVKDEEGFQ